jgi:hypothetical protein
MPVMFAIRDVIWLAGLLEGEGCFTKCRESIRISIAMTDKDIIERVAVLFKCPVGVWTRRGTAKTPYNAIVCGNDAAAWMMMIFPFMGSRRQARIKELLKIWRDKKPRYTENTICGHTDRPYCARGMCSKCYDSTRKRAERLGT